MLRDPRFPNVLPEGTEDIIRVVAVRVLGTPEDATASPWVASQVLGCRLLKPSAVAGVGLIHSDCHVDEP